MSHRSWSLKLVIIGSPSVGKTSLRRSYLGLNFQRNYIKTIGADFSFKELEFGEDRVNTSIWDLAGQDEFSTVHPQYFRGAVGAVVVYDVTNPSTRDRVESWVIKYKELAGSYVGPILILGNKMDLVSNGMHSTVEEEHTKLVEHMRHNHELDILDGRTSALTGEAVEEGFTKLIKLILQKQKEAIFDVKEEKTASEEMLRENLPAGYIVTFHEVKGPLVIAKSPPPEVPEYSDQEFLSVIKISSIIDFDDVSEQKYATGSFSWVEPVGNFSYLAFAVDNTDARGGKSLYIIGFVAKREIREIVDGFKPVIDGFLHSAMNEFSTYVEKNRLNFTTGPMPTNEELAKHTEMTDILTSLRKKILDLIANKL